MEGLFHQVKLILTLENMLFTSGKKIQVSHFGPATELNVQCVIPLLGTWMSKSQM